MPTYTVGKEIQSQCGSCKLPLAHTIVAMDGSKIVKVECHTCKKTHSFKDPAAAKAKKRSSRAKKAATKPVAQIWEEAMKAAAADPEPYSVKAIYQSGDLLAHPKFGPGVVERLVDNDKVSVIFKADVKVLVHAR
jgi:hypothetical protein